MAVPTGEQVRKSTKDFYSKMAAGGAANITDPVKYALWAEACAKASACYNMVELIM